MQQAPFAVVLSWVLEEGAAAVLTGDHIVNELVSPGSSAILEWTKKFVVNRLLYTVLLLILCLGIFPFCTLFPFTLWLGRWWDSVSSNKTHAAKLEGIWDILGKPYDHLVKLVG